MAKQHRYPPRPAPLFLTWHLYDCLPPAQFPKPGALLAGRAFTWIDRYLNQARKGPTWLADDEVASAVTTAIRDGEGTLYHLHAFVVMQNHAHLLLEPFVPFPKLLSAVKRAAARKANLILERTRKPFWDGRSYDHWIAGPEEMEWVRNYIENDPVRAGLVSRPEQYRWSSANAGPLGLARVS